MYSYEGHSMFEKMRRSPNDSINCLHKFYQERNYSEQHYESTYFLNGEDIHAATAKEVFSLKNNKPSESERRAAKAINFGLIYGISSFGLSKQLKINNNEAKEYIDKYFAKYNGVREFMDNTKKFAKNHDMLKPFINEKKIQQLIILSNGHYIMSNENDNLIFWNLKLGQKGFDKNASPYIWSYIIEKNNKEQIQLDETNEKMDALKVKEIRSFRNNRKYSEEFSKFYERLKGI